MWKRDMFSDWPGQSVISRASASSQQPPLGPHARPNFPGSSCPATFYIWVILQISYKYHLTNIFQIPLQITNTSPEILHEPSQIPNPVPAKLHNKFSRLAMSMCSHPVSLSGFSCTHNFFNILHIQNLTDRILFNPNLTMY